MVSAVAVTSCSDFSYFANSVTKSRIKLESLRFASLMTIDIKLPYSTHALQNSQGKFNYWGPNL